MKCVPTRIWVVQLRILTVLYCWIWIASKEWVKWYVIGPEYLSAESPQCVCGGAGRVLKNPQAPTLRNPVGSACHPKGMCVWTKQGDSLPKQLQTSGGVWYLEQMGCLRSISPPVFTYSGRWRVKWCRRAFTLGGHLSPSEPLGPLCLAWPFCYTFVRLKMNQSPPE